MAKGISSRCPLCGMPIEEEQKSWDEKIGWHHEICPPLPEYPEEHFEGRRLEGNYVVYDAWKGKS